MLTRRPRAPRLPHLHPALGREAKTAVPPALTFQQPLQCDRTSSSVAGALGATMSRHTELIRARSAATGESHATVFKAIAALPAGAPVIPEATDDQARLETDLLLELRDLGTMGPPYDPPLGITRCTPSPDRAVLEIARPHLSDALTLWLPRSDADSEPLGVPGLRVRHRGRFLELRQLGLDALVKIPATRAQWSWARDQVHALHTCLGTPLWSTDPLSLTALERHTIAMRHKHFQGPGSLESVRLGSALLRRLRLLKTHNATGVAGYSDLWRGLPSSRFGGFPVHLEWGRPHHVAALARQLADPASLVALPGALRQTLEQSSSSTIHIRSAHDIEVALRPCPVSFDGPLWDWERRLPLHGTHQAPQKRPSHLSPVTVLNILIDAFTNEHFGPLAREELQIKPRGSNGWYVVLPDRIHHPVEYLRILAWSRVFAGLWPTDLQDAVDVHDTGRLLRMVKLSGVDVAFH